MKIVTAERKEKRLAVLNDAAEKLEARINEFRPEDVDKTAELTARLNEYRQSIENLEKFGAETI